MPYIPKEHEQYPVLPYRRKHGGEVFSYLSWPTEKIVELAGEDLTPLYYSLRRRIWRPSECWGQKSRDRGQKTGHFGLIPGRSGAPYK
jgi:hypothetical protein